MDEAEPEEGGMYNCNDEAEDSKNDEEVTTTDYDENAGSRRSSFRKDSEHRVEAATEQQDQSLPRIRIANENEDVEEEEVDGLKEIEKIKKEVMEDVTAFRRRGSRAPQVNIHQTRRRLFAAARADDQISIDSICKEIIRSGKSLVQDDLRDGLDKKTVLHQALLNRSMKAADTLMKYGGSKLLFKNCRVKVQSLNSKMTCLHILCENGEKEWVKRVLKELDTKDRKAEFLNKMVLKKVETHRIRNFSCLHLAAMNGHEEITEVLIKEAKMTVDIKNMKKETPLLWAARFNQTKVMKLLISFGADINRQNDKGTSPLYWAVKFNNFSSVHILLNQSGINIQCCKPVSEETPIHLACALNRMEIAEKLIKGGAKVSEHSRIDGNTCLHFAAAAGHLDIIALLLRQPSCEINSINFNYDTPLQLASRNKRLQVVQELLHHDADISKSNKFNETVWVTAIRDKENSLFALLVAHCTNKSILLESSGEPLLHVAARFGDVEKIEKLLELGLDTDLRDDAGNTFYHVAARCNHVGVLERFAERVDVNALNQDGDTAAHVACSQGHLSSVKFLISTVNATLASSQDSQTILHVACYSHKASDELVKYCIQMTRSALSWDMVNHQDIQGNTALHICAIKGRQEIIRHMSDFNPSVKNNDGNTPAMAAAKQKNIPSLTTILETFKDTIDLEQMDNNGNTLLHILAEQGEFSLIGRVIDLGVDLGKQNNVGNTMLHIVAESCVKNKESITEYSKVVDVVVEKSVIWWCHRTAKAVPLEDSLAYHEARKESVDFLRSRIFNETGFSAISYAAFLGVKPLVRKLIQVPEVYMIKAGENVSIDITGFTHDTMKDETVEKSKAKTYCCPWLPSLNKVNNSEAYSYQKVGEQSKESERKCKSLLDTIVQVRPLPVANDMLSIIPLKQIVDNYWSMYQWIYAVLLVAHIVYMTALTVYGLDILKEKHDFETTNNSTEFKSCNISMILVVYFITYPVLMTLFFACFYYIGTWIQGSRTLSWHAIWRYIRGVFQTLIGFLYLLCLLAWLIPVAFDVLQDDINVNYALATALLIGWLQTIVFTNGFQSVHDLTNVLLHMFFQDILRFFVFYAVVLVAFSAAFRALFLLSPEISPDHPDVWSVMFGTFNIMFDSGDLLVDDIDDKYNRAGHSVVYLKLLYVAYVISTAAVLLNILIAMLNSTYSSVQEIERSAWKVETIDLGMQVETILPCIPKLFRMLGLKGKGITQDPKSGRWFITVPSNEFQSKGQTNELSIEGRVEGLENTMQKLVTVLNEQNQQIKGILSSMERKEEKKKDSKEKRSHREK